MSGWRAVRLGDLPRRGGWIPVRSELDVGPVGVNAWVGEAAGDEVIEPHDEVGDGHEELYLVLAGHALFRIAGDEVDAPAGTLVAVAAATHRSAVAVAPQTTILAMGARPGEPFTPSSWETDAVAGQPDAAGESA